MNIKYWICHATLLGVIRDKDLIPWDHDIDIAVWADDVSEEKIAKQFSEGDFSSFKPRKKGTKGNLYPFWIYVDENTG